MRADYGATEFIGPMTAALSFEPKEGFMKRIVILTDGDTHSSA